MAESNRRGREASEASVDDEGAALRPAVKEEEATYPVSRIVAEPWAFGYAPHVIAGAFFGADQGESLSRAEVDDRVAQWLARPVG